MSPHDAPLSPDVLLRQAAAGDAARARALLADVGPVKLLDAIVTQAELAVDDDRHRQAGIDAIAELRRASIEVMDMPQPWIPDTFIADTGELTTGELAEDFASDADVAAPDLTLVGWELVTVKPSELEAATVGLEARPWQLALVAFSDRTDATGTRSRRVVAAAADGRILGARLRRRPGDESIDVLDAVVTRDPDDLFDDAALAGGLLACLRQAARRG